MNDFDKRLLYIFKKFSLNASTFADKIGVQRSSMSHILSGRNKPSLDFILKIYEAFPELNLTWLALGEGSFYKSESSSLTHFSEVRIEENQITDFEFEKNETLEVNQDKENNQTPESTNDTFSSGFIKNEAEKLNKTTEVEQVLIFYKDGTFKTYKPR